MRAEPGTNRSTPGASSRSRRPAPTQPAILARPGSSWWSSGPSRRSKRAQPASAGWEDCERRGGVEYARHTQTGGADTRQQPERLARAASSRRERPRAGDEVEVHRKTRRMPPGPARSSSSRQNPPATAVQNGSRVPSAACPLPLRRARVRHRKATSGDGKPPSSTASGVWVPRLRLGGSPSSGQGHRRARRQPRRVFGQPVNSSGPAPVAGLCADHAGSRGPPRLR
jgi:hypothetical protein